MFDRIFDFITQILFLFRFWAVVREYERGVVLRFGRHVRTIEPGLAWVFPLAVDEVQTAIVTPRVTVLPTQSAVAADGTEVVLRAVLTWEVRDVAQHLLRSAEHEEAALDVALGTIAQHVMAVSWEDLRSIEVLRTIRSDVKRKARAYGVRVTNLQFVDLTTATTYRILGGKGLAE